jgi:hypothetical protein
MFLDQSIADVGVDGADVVCEHRQLSVEGAAEALQKRAHGTGEVRRQLRREHGMSIIDDRHTAAPGGRPGADQLFVVMRVNVEGTRPQAAA